MTGSSRRRQGLALVLLLGGQILVQGCSSIGPATPVAVTDVKSLSGTWAGIVYLPGSERDDVSLTVAEDGAYHVVSKVGLDVTTGNGRILVSDGRLVIEGDRGRGTGTVLRSPAGDIYIELEMTLSDNRNISAELWRMP